MKSGYKFATTLSVLSLLGLVMLHTGQTVSAAAEGKITGTVKLEGTPPHQRPIDMSKDPVCVKAHEGNSAHTETVVVGSGGGLANVVIYLSEGLPPAVAMKSLLSWVRVRCSTTATTADDVFNRPAISPLL